MTLRIANESALRWVQRGFFSKNYEVVWGIGIEFCFKHLSESVGLGPKSIDRFFFRVLGGF
jgi:hypothetical protein